MRRAVPLQSLPVTEPMQPSDYWDREVTTPVTPPAHSWTAHLAVRHYINRSIGGGDGTWPLDWFQGRYPSQVFERALSIGCGSGALERDLVRRGIVRSIEAFDASPASIELARELAAKENLGDRIHYSIADFNTAVLKPAAYDLVCFHQSLHHVDALEHLLREVRRALKPGGMLYLDEFVGPSRTYWNEVTIRWYSAIYRLFPRSLRYFEEFAMPVQLEDPSEAIRPSEILPLLRIGFSIEEFRGYGGNVLAMLFPDLLVERLTDAQVEAMIAAERAMIAAGAAPYHAVIVARPRSGIAAIVADVRYAIGHHFSAIARPVRAFAGSFRKSVRAHGTPEAAMLAAERVLISSEAARFEAVAIDPRARAVGSWVPHLRHAVKSHFPGVARRLRRLLGRGRR
jgi:SAM-dependent methyltransferase